MKKDDVLIGEAGLVDQAKSSEIYIADIEWEDLFLIRKQEISKELKLIIFISPVGDTVFNQKQIRQLKKEVKQLKEMNNINQEMLDIINKGIDIALQSADLYLKFEGD